MARTQAVYYRDSLGAEPVDEFIQALPPKRAAKIDDFVEEQLNGRLVAEPPPAVPRADIDLAVQRMADFKRRMNAALRRPPQAAGKDAPPKSRPVARTYQDG